MPNPSTNAETLLQHVGWIRLLARELTADEHAAEDLVQDACVVALERPLRDPVRSRSWLEVVVKNLLRQRVRGEGRRRVREEKGAAEELLAPATEVVLRVHEQRRLVETVLELAEPYRSTLLLRYFEELAPREIARRDGTPVQTVHSRLKRGLVLLRERLDERHGGERRAWLPALLLLARPSDANAAAKLWGILLMNSKAVLGVALVLACGAIAATVTLRTEEPALAELGSQAVAAPAQPERLEPSAESRAIAGTPAEERREVRAAPSEPATASAPAAAPRETTPLVVRGRVLDADARPVAGIAIEVIGSGQVAVSGGGGRFELTTASDACRLRSASADWVTVREGVHRVSSDLEPLVIVAPAIDLAGEVVNERGQPLANAKVGLQPPMDFDARFGEILDSTHHLTFSVRTDELGRFALEGVPGIEGARLRVLLDGYTAIEQSAPAVNDLALAFVLHRPEQPASGALSGRVVDPNGQPVPDARVATGLTSVLTDERGLFHLDLARAVTADTLAAVKAGYLPAILERPFAPDAENGGWPDSVELVLGGPALSIRGRVVDREGRARVGLKVWVADVTPFGAIGMMPASIEGLAAGAEVPPDAVESALMLPERDGDSFWDFTYAGAPPTAFWNWKLTDGTGAFEFNGLCDRDYRFALLDGETLQLHESDPIPAGARDAVIEMPESEVFESVAGVVVDDRGRPVEGVQVALRIDPFARRSRVFGGSAEFVMIENGKRVVTDAEGRFRFERVPRRGIRLILLSEDIVPALRDLRADEPQPDEIEIAVDLRCHLQIELEDPSLADEFEVFDEDGNALEIHSLSEGSHNVTTSGGIYAGRSRVVSVSGRARSIALLLGGARVDTVPIELWPGEVNVVRR